MKGKLCDVLQVWGFDGDFIIFSDGSLGFGLELTPLDISCWEAVKINETSGKIARFLNGLPSGIDIQFIQEISGGNTEVLTTHANIGINGTDLLSKNLSAVRVERLEQLDQAGHLPRHRLKVFVRGEMNSPLLKNAGLFSKTKLFEPLAEANLAQELIHVSRLRDTIMGGIRTLEIETKPLSSDAVATLLYWQWNPSREIPRNGYDPEDVRHSLLFTDAMVNESGFSLGKMHHRVISLKIHPDETFASMAAHLRELPFDSRLFLSVYVPDQQKEVSSLQTQRRVAFSMAKGKQSGVSDIDSESKFQDVESLLTQMIAQGEKVFQVSLTVVLQSKYEEELENRVAATLMNIRGLGGAEAMVESLAAFDIFSEVSIPNARSRERARRMKTSNLCDLLPIYGPWVGHTRPSLLLRSRMGSLIPFDPFARELPNSNQVISGGSGSGKSFLTNLLLLQMLKEKPKVLSLISADHIEN